MQRTAVQSSNVAEVGYDSSTLTLEVLFHSGAMYQYFDVPKAVYDALMQASSIGAFLNSEIKSSYRFAKL